LVISTNMVFSAQRLSRNFAVSLLSRLDFID
jgi:hypothetical protein